MKYTSSHDWVTIEGSIATIGITNYAQKELGDIVYVELPVKGHVLKAGEEVIVLESTKAAVDIYSPLSGEIVEINEELREHPERVNDSPESRGWLYKLKLSHPPELNLLLEIPPTSIAT